MLDIFTEELGRAHLVTKGARSKHSTLKGALQPFAPLLLCFSERGEVKTLRSVRAVSLALPLNGITFYSGLYIDELLLRVLGYETRLFKLFFDYSYYIQPLTGATGMSEPALYRFELALLEYLGYGVNFTHYTGSDKLVNDTTTYRYRGERGFIVSVVIDNRTFTGGRSKALNARESLGVGTPHAVKHFIRIVLKPYLGGRPLKDKELLRQLMPKRTVKIYYR